MSQGNLPPPLKPFDGTLDDFASWCEKLGTFLVDNDGLNPISPKPGPSTEAGDEDEGSEGRSSPEDSSGPPSPGPDPQSTSISDSEELDPNSNSRDPANIHAIATSVGSTSRPGFFGSGDTSTTFSLHKRRKLTPTLKNMIGEAHVRFARGEQGLAIELCMEVIKEMPTAAEPYHTLAMIFEHQREKSLQYLFIAGFLQPRGFKHWLEIGQMSMKLGNKRQAVMCYKKAMIGDPSNALAHLEYAKVLEDMEDFKGSLKAYAKFVLDFPDDGLNCVAALRRTAWLYHKLGDIPKAHESLSTALRSFPNHITSAETNLMLDLCIALKRYVEACQVLLTFEGVTFRPVIPQLAFETRESLSTALQSGAYECTPPDNFAVDLLAKLLTVLVHLEAYCLTEKLGHRMVTHSVEKYGDLYLDIAESYMAKKNYALAVGFLLPLIRSESYSQAAVWLRYAECLFLLVRLEDAVIAYQEVVKLAPNHSLAKLNLSLILQKLGRPDDALETLRQEADEEFLDPDLTMEKCHILYKRKHYKEFAELATKLLSRHCIEVNDIEDALVIVMVSNVGKRHAAVTYDRKDRGVAITEPEQKFLEKEANLEREYKLYIRLCRLFVQAERWDLLSRITYGGCTSTVFSQVPALETECEFHSFMASVYAGDDDILPQHMRIILGRYYTSTLVLNLFGVALHSDHARYTRHVTRLLEKSPKDNRLILLNAHISFSTGTYKNALMEYLTLYSQTPEDPLVPLMISSVLLHVMVQKTSQNRIQLCINIIAFMRRYMGLRGNCQESYYNMGRICHSMGLFPLAIHFYRLVLQTPPPPDDPDPIKQRFFGNSNALDLMREAAYNLAQIYRRSGAHDLARSLLFKYIRI